jgi:hypothetical protein
LAQELWMSQAAKTIISSRYQIRACIGKGTIQIKNYSFHILILTSWRDPHHKMKHSATYFDKT